MSVAQFASIDEAMEAISQALSCKYKSSTEVSLWSRTLASKLRRPSEQCSQIRILLEKHGYRSGVFQSPPSRERIERLKNDLRDIAPACIMVQASEDLGKKLEAFLRIHDLQTQDEGKNFFVTMQNGKPLTMFGELKGEATSESFPITIRTYKEVRGKSTTQYPASSSSQYAAAPAERNQTEFPGRIDDDKRFANQYDFEEAVGEGTYGCVFRAYDKQSRKVVAIKKVKMDHEEEGVPSTAIREVAVLKASHHPNIVRLLDVACTPGRLHLVFEFVEVNLKQHMKRHHLKLSKDHVQDLQKQLMCAIDYCHARGIMHRDLKPQNILIDGEDKLKVADFGMARAFCVPIPKYTHEVVTTWYRSPEILFGCEKYSLGVDVWSAGCILGEMATGAALFHGDSEIDTIFQIFRKLGTPSEAEWPGIMQLPDFKDTFPKWRRRPWTDIRNIHEQLGRAGTNLMDLMLCYDPKGRCSAKQALQHEYFATPLNESDIAMS
eukprot:TRINITY_DN13583_c0_g2_i2.p1 TRINITY_DN13583_c0_g2~~TRINITY_DN13583_c0_g2_i2.p1  ORF type:complete len:493 (-),score=88.77 TRINITY_DN13583_c0_g2_i2:235-1713(-)